MCNAIRVKLKKNTHNNKQIRMTIDCFVKRIHANRGRKFRTRALFRSFFYVFFVIRLAWRYHVQGVVALFYKHLIQFSPFDSHIGHGYHMNVLSAMDWKTYENKNVHNDTTTTTCTHKATAKKQQEREEEAKSRKCWKRRRRRYIKCSSLCCFFIIIVTNLSFVVDWKLNSNQWYKSRIPRNEWITYMEMKSRHRIYISVLQGTFDHWHSFRLKNTLWIKPRIQSKEEKEKRRKKCFFFLLYDCYKWHATLRACSFFCSSCFYFFITFSISFLNNIPKNKIKIK